MLWGGGLWSGKGVKGWVQVFLRILWWRQVIQMFFASTFFFTFMQFDENHSFIFLIAIQGMWWWKKMKKNEIPLEKFEILNLLHHLLHIKNGQLSYSVSLIMESLQPGGQLKTLIKKSTSFYLCTHFFTSCFDREWDKRSTWKCTVIRKGSRRDLACDMKWQMIL